ncbi:BFH_collapsed_G0037650.mRNA.1.CDS.1 [Saccharomyces cerevisiae]|nr:BFH_HP2_G0036710.mRNA.1.CDS.1 [Saccharomyces cerevisiae]CAI6655968.1 BFH_HP2_G0036710.mRNA.1.CDS.1 [Saccharomyces cerevisiae]CAI6667851.1 BFH_HP1_G0037080.mRNA.1.CDS.1 [Saccharomyces cerevisiae]CAI7243905.1 BFH_collapsed_G0037650.mRNA.1.CDS.1 [Saccharomyces cerevisiae]
MSRCIRQSVCTNFNVCRRQCFSTYASVLKEMTHPIKPSAQTLRHLQFTQRIPFQKGLEIQETLVRANLDIKDIQSKIERKLIQLDEEYKGTATINDNEKRILDKVMAMKPNPIILTFEFEPTYTGGKRIKKTMTPDQIAAYESFIPETQKDNPRPKFVQVERGGQVTFHGPGQIVIYIVLDLKTFQSFPAKCLVSCIEQATIRTLKNTKMCDDTDKPLNLDAMTTKDTGVWVENGKKKVASVGIHVRRSITSHGVAINVNTDLSYMNSFEMCGLKNTLTTSIMEQRPDAVVNVQSVAISFVKEMTKLLGIKTLERMQIDDVNILKKNP